MKIIKIETIWQNAKSRDAWAGSKPQSRQALPNNTWIRVYADNGLIGLGETYYVPRAVGAIVHDVFAPLLIGRDPLDIENHWNNLFSLVNFFGSSGAEMRAISALDLALWDLAGQYVGQPIYNLLGGRNRDRVPVYNTCVSYGQYLDYQAWTEGRAGELAENLLKSGIKAMKIWPFDRFGWTLGGPLNPQGEVTMFGQATAAGVLCHRISNDDLREGVQIIESIRKAVGDKMAVAIEGHARWNLPTATRIARSLEPLDIFWLEEIMPPDNPEAYVRLKSETTVPLCQSERLFSRFAFRPIVEQKAADIIMPDVCWCGGLTEARKICSLADTYFLPITTHDTIGPVALWAAAHLMMHIPNAMIMETVRGYVTGWYNDVVTDQIEIREGWLALPDKPGLGTSLREEFLQQPGVHVEVTTEKELQAW
ncbi:MAG: mandelate racemase/muconate lactonizing enzyme family protein [Acidobacteriaceae bacterium]|nr:mandelate racemase/muconate lactonizing enzyme family protein [Acidobacteriaceae bacterium]